MSQAGRSAYALCSELFPLNRSNMGKGIRESMHIIASKNQAWETKYVPTGTKVQDWCIPKEWNINDGYIEHVETGKRFAEFKRSNLHVVGYSIPVDSIMNLNDFAHKIYTAKDPSSIPYVTSYYKEEWGFCMSQLEKDSLPRGLQSIY